MKRNLNIKISGLSNNGEVEQNFMLEHDHESPFNVQINVAFSPVLPDNSTVKIAEPEDDLNIKILQAIEKVFGFTLEDLRIKNRKRKHVFARAIYAYLIKERSGISYEDIGGTLNLHHTTVMNCLKIYKKDIRFNIEFQNLVKKVKALII